MRIINNYNRKYNSSVENPPQDPTNKSITNTAYNSTENDSIPESNLHTMNIECKDYGPYPFVVNINEATMQNNCFRTALWTGTYLQVTLMCIPVGGEIGLEIHPDTDQFLRIEAGHGLVKMGDRKDCLYFQEKVCDDYAIMIPAGKWHNLINTGDIPIKLYSIYAPPHHPHGTVHATKEDAEAAERSHEQQQEERYCQHNDQHAEQHCGDYEEHFNNSCRPVRTAPTNRLFGADAAKADRQPSLDNMLIYAIQDEYLARARCLQAIEKFGRQRPFSNILNAVEMHINYLVTMSARYHVVLPTDNSAYYVKKSDTIKVSLQVSMQGEIENIAMYDRFLAQNLPSDVKSVFILLRKASQSHLQMFQRILSFH